MTVKQDSDQQLKDDVTELKVTVRDVVKPALADIQDKLGKMSYVDQVTFTDTMKTVDQRLDDLEAGLRLAQPVISFFKALSSRFVQIIIIAIIGGVIYAIVTQIPRWIGLSA